MTIEQIILVIGLLTVAFITSQLAIILFLAKYNSELIEELDKARPPF
jgi:hypothetical protein